MSKTVAVSAIRNHTRTATRSNVLHRVRRVGYVVLGLQLIISLAWSTLLYDRFSVTFDFTMFQQAWVLIAHGLSLIHI